MGLRVAIVYDGLASLVVLQVHNSVTIRNSVWTTMEEVTGAQLIAESLKTQVRPLKKTNIVKIYEVC